MGRVGISPNSLVLLKAVEADLDGPDRDLGASLQPEFPEDMHDVVADRTPDQYEPLGDLGVREPGRHQDSHVLLSLRDPPQLVGYLTTAAVLAFAGHLLHQFGTMGDDPEPPGNRFEEAEVTLGEEVRLLRVGLEDAAPLAGNLERNVDGAANAEPLDHTAKLIGISIGPAREVRYTRLERAGCRAAIGDRLTVQPERALPACQQGCAGSRRYQGVALRIVAEDVDLIGAESRGYQRTRFVELWL
jgi:hypothetical protein